MTKRILSAFLFAAAISASASEMGFSYNAAGADPTGYGFTKPQTYDVGIALNSPQIIGKQIKCISVPILDSEAVSDISVWLSKELTVSKGDVSVFTPDIMSYEASVVDGAVNFTLPEPYTVPEEGVFIGYSFTVSKTSVSKVSPIAVADGNTAGGLWLHATKSQKRWTDMAPRNNMVSDIYVILEGMFPKDAAEFRINSQNLYAAKDEPSEVAVTLTNWGSSGISSFDYTYSVNGNQYEGTYSFNSPIPSVLGRVATADIEITPVNEVGDYVYDLTITKINGVENELTTASASVPLTVQPFIAIYRPLVEEYTGFACGWCPNGYVMLEQMKLYHGDLFVAISYHTYGNDGLTFVSEGPLRPSGFPTAVFNRGSQLGIDDIPVLWEKNCLNNTAADVEVSLDWADSSHQKLIANARTRFVKDIQESGYLFSIALVGDGLSNEAWAQNNSYDNYEADGKYAGPFWDLFIGMPSPVSGLVYNDVVLHYNDFDGIEGSLPSSVEAEKWYEFSYEFDIADIRNYAGEDVVNDFNRTRAIAIVIDKTTGIPVNCCSSIYPDGTRPSESGVETINADAYGMETLFYDLQGQRVNNPGKGLYIRIDRLSDGSTKTSKIIL